MLTMLTEEAYRERRWKSYPAIRQVLEGKSMSDTHYGFTSVSDNVFDQIQRLMNIVILIREHQQAIIEMAQSIGQNQICDDLQHIEKDIHHFVQLFSESEKEIQNISRTIRNLSIKQDKY